MKYRQKRKNFFKKYKKGSYDREMLTHCQNCGKKMDPIRDPYFLRYGFCSIHCGMMVYGLSESNFF